MATKEAYKVKFSPKEAVKNDITIGQPFACTTCGAVISKVKVMIRQFEIDVLKNILNAFANECKEPKKCNSTWDTVAKLDNLGEDEDHIIFDKADMEAYDAGFPKVPQKSNWQWALALLKQFDERDKMKIETAEVKTVESTTQPLPTEITPEAKPKK